jgi:hypothetical protein
MDFNGLRRLTLRSIVYFSPRLPLLQPPQLVLSINLLAVFDCLHMLVLPDDFPLSSAPIT